MVRHKVVIVAQALEQLLQIVEYVRENDSESRARIVHDGIVEAIESLLSMPHRNPVYETRKKTKYSYRYLPKWSFNIIYRVEDDLQVVYVITIVNAARLRKNVEANIE